MASIRLENVSRRFSKDFTALDGVSLEVGDREVVTVVGPSGCGKSTLLRVIAGLDSPTSGHVYLDGERAKKVPARARNIAMVFQSYALYPHMNCHENLALNLRLRGLSSQEIDRRVQETAAVLEIGDLLQKRPRELSGGQRQRVALGRALIRNPRAFLFDEPLSNLDAQLREKVRHELKELFERIHATVVYVTHDQVEAMTLADRVMVLDHGRVQQIGTPEDLYRHPENRFVASFIGSPAMNIFDSKLEYGVLRIGSREIDIGLDFSGPVSIGIRPEAIRLGSGIPAKVAWVEALGAQYLVGANVDGISLVVRAGDRPVVGEQVGLEIVSEDIHVFDKATSQNLIPRGAGRTSRGQLSRR